MSAEKDTFNYYLSLNRQVIERAFGILVARWGILWRPLRFNQEKNSLLVRVLCRLHNICVEAYGIGANATAVHPSDITWTNGTPGNPVMEVWYTDEHDPEVVGRGARTDLERCPKRQRLTDELQMQGCERPRNSKLQQFLRDTVGRRNGNVIRDLA